MIPFTARELPPPLSPPGLSCGRRRPPGGRKCQSGGRAEGQAEASHNADGKVTRLRAEGPDFQPYIIHRYFQSSATATTCFFGSHVTYLDPIWRKGHRQSGSPAPWWRVQAGLNPPPVQVPEVENPGANV